MSEFVELEDLLGIRDYVETAHGRLEIRGLGGGEILKLITKYPSLAKTGDGVKLSVPSMMENADVSVFEIIAMACDWPKATGVKAAKRFSASDQIAILTAVLQRSMPDGPGPFADRVAELIRTVSPD